MTENDFQIKESFKSKQEAVEYAEKLNKAYTDLKDSFNKKLDERFDKLEKLLADQSKSLETQGKALDDLKTDNGQLAREVARLNKRVVTLEREAINANQYGRRRQLELWNLPETITSLSPDQLKSKCATLLSLTGVAVESKNIDVVHKMKREGRVIMELDTRDLQGRILRARKELKNKKTSLTTNKCPSLSVVESMCPEYKKLDYICRQLLKKKMIEKTFFYNRALHIEAEGEHKLISHMMDLIHLFGPEVVHEIANNNRY